MLNSMCAFVSGALAESAERGSLRLFGAGTAATRSVGA